MADKELQTHVIKDETLGGIEREYIEVERGAEVGELIIVNSSCGHFYDEGHVGKVSRASNGEDIKVNFRDNGNSFVFGDGHWYVNDNNYRTLNPTDIIRIDGRRYTLSGRRAHEGDLILVKMNANVDECNLGKVYKVTSRFSDSLVDTNGKYADGSQLNVFDSEYYTLTPVESTPQSPQSYDDVIANLVRRVAELERKVSNNTDNIETWAREVESVKHSAKPKQVTLEVETLARLLGDVRP